MIDVLGFQLHIELHETDVPDLIRHGWLSRDSDSTDDVIRVRFTHKGKTEMLPISAVRPGECTVVGYRNDAGQEWVIGRLECRSPTEAPPPLH